MKPSKYLLVAALAMTATLSDSLGQGTAFTYQGQLLSDGIPARDGLYDFELRLFAGFDDPAVQVGPSRILLAQPVTNAFFALRVDFGSGVFTGNPRWLEVHVNTNGLARTRLRPRTELTPTPYAILAENLSADPANGVLPDARLSANVARIDVAQTFTGAKTFGNDVSFSSGAQILLDPGTVGAPSLAFVGDVNTGLFRPGADTLAVATLGTERMRVTSAGRVGIGTATPATELHVIGSGFFGPDSGGLGSAAGPGVRAFYWPAALSGSIFAYDYSSNQAVNLLLQQPGGSVGIGLTDPAARLDVNGSIQSEGEITLKTTLGLKGIKLVADSTIRGVFPPASGGYQLFYNTDETPTLLLDGDVSRSGLVQVRGPSGAERVALEGGLATGGGAISVRDTNGTLTVRVLGAESASEGGQVSLYQANGLRTLELDGDHNGGYIAISNTNGQSRLSLGADTVNGGVVNVRDLSGTPTVQIIGAESAATGGQIILNKANGSKTVEIDGDANGQGGWMALNNNSGRRTIELDAGDSSGFSRITTDVLEIKGGSDLSENFDLAAGTSGEPGMLVCIDPNNPGQLVPSRRAYDTTVAGVLSGAGGVKPGMLMGQSQSIATGKHAVALTGRVYCMVDATESPIKPGDLITTSDTPGHGMKAEDPTRAHGAIIGKAMTGKDHGKGLVLVLVSLQ